MGFKTKDFPYELKVGRDLDAVSNLQQAIKDQEEEFDFVMVDLCHALNFRTHKTIESRDIALTRAGNIMNLYIFSYRHQH